MVSPTEGHSLMLSSIGHVVRREVGGGGGGELGCMPTDLCVTYNCYCYYLTQQWTKRQLIFPPTQQEHG